MQDNISTGIGRETERAARGAGRTTGKILATGLSGISLCVCMGVAVHSNGDVAFAHARGDGKLEDVIHTDVMSGLDKGQG